MTDYRPAKALSPCASHIDTQVSQLQKRASIPAALGKFDVGQLALQTSI